MCRYVLRLSHMLFCRKHLLHNIIVYTWLNDEDTKRVYEGSDDAYWVFRKMLEAGHLPDDWSVLLAEARTEAGRLQQVAAQSVHPAESY